MGQLRAAMVTGLLDSVADVTLPFAS